MAAETLELLGIGIVALAPIYGALWTLLQNLSHVEIQVKRLVYDVDELSKKVRACRVCTDENRNGGQYT